ncbi:hypothetical protein BO85DRAFT_14510 [Aspergillus piperis CBS 112811]|uniref:Uncharacterized protein n=1 Tax=Aspergillus piperis CBS 112811 TaxID=1448313 RepID=A0A8G1VSJ4_9EURO|nr:hypothetical protein BO85DRAFT_14510 [Aspergillus piperis CBS 112811]RAH62992.1 hypothetical protein BO85DRAFT_14510 [Aspergillus piperis CBS 112811]
MAAGAFSRRYFLFSFPLPLVFFVPWMFCVCVGAFLHPPYIMYFYLRLVLYSDCKYHRKFCLLSNIYYTCMSYGIFRIWFTWHAIIKFSKQIK